MDMMEMFSWADGMRCPRDRGHGVGGCIAWVVVFKQGLHCGLTLQPVQRGHQRVWGDFTLPRSPASLKVKPELVF